ncbi:putative protein TPRXL-like 2 [Homarus americanus]|uniref:Uncharacterized protein n=2 Tax=Homarus americanus TaxID=6706 RepID=A0A8J5N3B0_HOMAM|nr:putative protein TPRXL-like 2 [Homarus americanus]
MTEDPENTKRTLCCGVTGRCQVDTEDGRNEEVKTRMENEDTQNEEDSSEEENMDEAKEGEKNGSENEPDEQGKEYQETEMNRREGWKEINVRDIEEGKDRKEEEELPGESEKQEVVEGQVRLRKNSIQERRKFKGPSGPTQDLRLPVQRSFSSSRLSFDQYSDSGSESAKSDPVQSPSGGSGRSGPRSPALTMLSRVFSFHGIRSPLKKSPPCSPGKSPTSDPGKRKSLHLPLHRSPSSPTFRNTSQTNGASRFSFEGSPKSLSPKSNTSPKSFLNRDSQKNKSPSSPNRLGSMMRHGSQFYIPSPGSSSKNSGSLVSSPGSPPPLLLGGTVEMMDGAGILYRPSSSRGANHNRNHRRTRSDTFRLMETNRGGKEAAMNPRKRSRDDSE